MRTNPICKTTPRPGERVYDYLTRTARELLLRAGASESEADDFSEVLMARNGDMVLTMRLEAARTMLEDWRAEMRAIAAEFRENRRQHIAAGYRSQPVEAPVYLNGKTQW